MYNIDNKYQIFFKEINIYFILIPWKFVLHFLNIKNDLICLKKYLKDSIELYYMDVQYTYSNT